MPTVTVDRADLSVDDVASTLRRRLDESYKIEPRPDREAVAVRRSALTTCKVRLVRGPESTELRIHGGGIIIGRIINEFGIAGRVAAELREADFTPGVT